MWLVNVQDIMCTKLISLSMHAKISEIIKLVEQCDSGKVTHNAFPVVDCSKTNARLHGIVTLEHIRKVAEDAKALSAIMSHSQIQVVHILEYSDRSPITIYPNTKVARAFELFRKLGMRHLCVVDNQGILVGIVTRKDLMTFSLGDNIRRCV